MADAAHLARDDVGAPAQSAALLLRGQERYSEAIAAYRHLLDNDPNSHFAYSQIGMLLSFLGRDEEAIPMIETAIRRDPRNPSVRIFYGNLARSLLVLGRYEDSIAWSRRALAAASNASPIQHAQYNLQIAAACVWLGQLDEAQRAIAEANRVTSGANLHQSQRFAWRRGPKTFFSRLLVAAIDIRGEMRHYHEASLSPWSETDNGDGMKPLPDPHHRHRLAAEIISHAVWLYHVFSLSLPAGHQPVSLGRRSIHELLGDTQRRTCIALSACVVVCDESAIGRLHWSEASRLGVKTVRNFIRNPTMCSRKSRIRPALPARFP